MGSGIAASLDTRDSPASPSLPSHLTAPASERLCDTVVVGFALWTVCSHAVVAAGGGLSALLILYAVALAGALGVWLARRARARPHGRGDSAAAPQPTRSAAPPEEAGPALTVLRGASLVAGVVAALSLTGRSEQLALWWSAVLVLGLAAVVVVVRDAPLLRPPARDRASEPLLWLLAVGGVVLALISHRPDADDAFYVNTAVAAVDHPSQPLLSVDTLHGLPDVPLYLPVYRVQSYELLNGAVAYLTGIPAMHTFHWVSAGLAALLVPLAHAMLLRILTPRRWLAAVATIMVVLVAAGETHRWYGNFALVRIWQGKAIFLSVFQPLIFAYGLRFAARHRPRDLAMLGAAQIAAVGCNSTALWAAPAGAFLALAAAVQPSLRGLAIVLLGALASVYALGAAWLARSSLAVPLEGWIAQVHQLPPQLYDAFVVVLGDSRLLVFGVASMLTAWAFAPPGIGRRFAVIAPLAVLVVLLNPYTSGWMSGNVTGPAYWRSLWVLPLPTMIALILTAPLDFAGGRLSPRVRRGAWLILVAAFALVLPQYNGLSRANGVELSWPRLKVPQGAYRWAMAVNASVAPGSHVAVPSEVALWIGTRDHHAYPLLVRYYLRSWPGKLSREALQERMAMQRLLDAPDLIASDPEPFRAGLNRFAVQAVCLVDSPRAGAARAILLDEGFRQTIRRDDHELWVRASGGAAHPSRP